MMIFDKLFKKRQKTEVSLVANQSNSFGAFGGDAYSSEIYRSAIDAIARNTAKLKGSHIIKDELNKTTQSNINYLLQIQPNEIMSAYDFLYKIVTHLYIYNNAFVLIDRDESGIKGFYPINATNASLLEDSRGNLYIRLFIRDGEPIIQKYSDIIHLRRHFNSSQYFGDANDAIMNTLDLAHTQNEGLNVSIKSGANIRGIMKYDLVLPEADMIKTRDRFIKDFLGVSNNGGVMITDTKSSFIPIESKPINIDDKQLLAIKTKIYDYLGISENIVTSKYNENEWGAFYESVIEPIATQMSLEFTRKIFTQREIRFKNYIMFESGRLQFASNSTKINLISQLIPYGLLSINQALEILNLPAVKDGDKRLQTLNVVDINKANKYQVGEDNERD
ncbi:phage portal protein [Campylobacter sp. RM16191]|uniref:phage portal protein n=2 Tax=unclassified Campylobacter TaxID=2593542 RepID=UPI001B8D4E43|nr:phage portal protein [Campylobacter sp. RM16191]